MRGKTVRRLAVLAAVGLLCHGAWAGTWNIGILAMRGEASTRSHWQPLAKTLSQQLPGETFHIQPLDLHQMQEAVNQGTVQFVITNPAQFVQLNSHAPLRWLASLRSTRPPPRHFTGARQRRPVRWKRCCVMFVSTLSSVDCGWMSKVG